MCTLMSPYENYTLSLHDALPISPAISCCQSPWHAVRSSTSRSADPARQARSEEHTSELQSPCNLVCRLLLEKKKMANYDQPKPTEHSSIIEPSYQAAMTNTRVSS